MERLRVVSINCSGGSRKAAEEAIPFEPDIVLLQESPSESVVREIGEAMFGDASDVVWSVDCSIIARGRLQPATSNARHYVQATLVTASGQTFDVASLRLSPPLVRYDLWSPGCWSQHAALRRQHRREAVAIAQALSVVPSESPILIGGDCNAPAGDGALREWSSRLRDAFDSAGRGWGATVLNGLPALRFDQLWCSQQLEPIAVWSVKTKYSDHRLVVGDFKARRP